MILVAEHDRVRLQTVITLTIPDREIEEANFDSFDRALFAEINRDGKSIADVLLAWEVVARRIEQYHEASKP